MIREISQNDIAEAVRVIRESFGTVAREFGFTERNAPRFTAFATDEKRIGYHLNTEHRPMFGYFDGSRPRLSQNEHRHCRRKSSVKMPVRNPRLCPHRHKKVRIFPIHLRLPV